MVKIQKRDGTEENYDRKKLLTSLVRAQLPPDQAQNVLTNIEAWLTSQNQQVIKSPVLRKKIIEVIKPINQEAAHSYEIYRRSQAEKQKGS